MFGYNAGASKDNTNRATIGKRWRGVHALLVATAAAASTDIYCREIPARRRS